VRGLRTFVTLSVLFGPIRGLSAEEERDWTSVMGTKTVARYVDVTEDGVHLLRRVKGRETELVVPWTRLAITDAVYALVRHGQCLRQDNYYVPTESQLQQLLTNGLRIQSYRQVDMFGTFTEYFLGSVYDAMHERDRAHFDGEDANAYNYRTLALPPVCFVTPVVNWNRPKEFDVRNPGKARELMAFAHHAEASIDDGLKLHDKVNMVALKALDAKGIDELVKYPGLELLSIEETELGALHMLFAELNRGSSGYLVGRNGRK